MELKQKKKDLEKDLILEMRAQGRMLAPLILPALKEYFGEFEVLGTESNLYEKINNEKLLKETNFKGFIDLIIKTKKDNKIHILDFKTAGWGWDSKKKSDKIINYQLTFYKYFYAQKYGIDLKNIETHFCLLKRTAKKDQIEPFRITSGDKKIANALAFLEKAINTIYSGKYWKNKKGCIYCPYRDTLHCK